MPSLRSPPPRLGISYPLHRSRYVAPFQQLFPNGWPVLPQVPRQFLYPHPIHSGAPSIRSDSLQCLRQILALTHLLHQISILRRAFGCAHRHRHFGPFPGGPWGFTPVPFREGQTHLDVLPLYAHEIRVLLATPNRSGLHPSLSGTITTPSADFCTAVREPHSSLSSLSETRCRPPGVGPPAFIAHPPDLQPWPLTDMDFVT